MYMISNKYFDQILQRNSMYVPMVLKRKIWWMSANPDTKKCVGIKIVSPRQGHFGQKCQHLAVGETCHRHDGNFLSQDLDGGSNPAGALCELPPSLLTEIQ